MRKLRYLLTPIAAFSAAGCGGGGSGVMPLPSVTALEAACPQLAAASVATGLAVPNTSITGATLVSATPTTPAHCQIDGQISPRTGIDGQRYAIKFRLRMPTNNWNHRFFMNGGGGTDGNLVDPVARVAQGYATIGTDSGHDNAVDNAPNAGGTASFGVDPQARIDFAYNAYDLVTQVGKALVSRFYNQPASRSYFMGCSEGGREGMLMTQRFPESYDGVVCGAPVLHLPLGPLAGVYTTQRFAGLAMRNGLTLANGDPALGKTYSDPDLMLVRNAVLKACDSLDGLADGILDNLSACTKSRVEPELAQLQCTGAKTDSCLTSDQIQTLENAFDGAVNSRGQPLYADWPWDAGIGGKNGATFSQSWRNGWLGSYTATTNTASKLGAVLPLAVAYSTPPTLPIATADIMRYALNYNFETDPAKLYATSSLYQQSAAQLYFTDKTDLSPFMNRGGKLMVYHGGSDSTVSLNDTLRWYDAMNAQMGSNAQDFARFYIVPGMGHCSGGPATDSFDMLPQLVDWVENGVPPDSVPASASVPGYFGVAARTRPLCPYPKQARFRGAGDINDAASFTCQ